MEQIEKPFKGLITLFLQSIEYNLQNKRSVAQLISSWKYHLQLSVDGKINIKCHKRTPKNAQKNDLPVYKNNVSMVTLIIMTIFIHVILIKNIKKQNYLQMLKH